MGEVSGNIKSLSAADVAALMAGEGWGLARAAELNGLPGPVHLLELRHAIPLRPEQVHGIEALYAEMNAQARLLGERYLAAEARIEHAFRGDTATPDALRTLLAQSAALHAELRYTHLAAHLRAAALLSEAQIARYNSLRGYTAEQTSPHRQHSARANR
ncbi:MAG: hypothetical protein HY342_12530 [Candidatus Lambdaproteobacteria bacterium]|nr:hypothetical protein [Candidatus Lambdaproteobacteria bacterium]